MPPGLPQSPAPASRFDILDVESAARRLGLGPAEGRAFLERHGLIRRLAGHEWVPWGPVYDLVMGAGPDPGPSRSGPHAGQDAPEVLTVREAVALLRMRDGTARAWLRKMNLVIDVEGRKRVRRSAVLAALEPHRSGEPGKAPRQVAEGAAPRRRYRPSDAF